MISFVWLCHIFLYKKENLHKIQSLFLKKYKGWTLPSYLNKQKPLLSVLFKKGAIVRLWFMDSDAFKPHSLPSLRSPAWLLYNSNFQAFTLTCLSTDKHLHVTLITPSLLDAEFSLSCLNVPCTIIANIQVNHWPQSGLPPSLCSYCCSLASLSFPEILLLHNSARFNSDAFLCTYLDAHPYAPVVIHFLVFSLHKSTSWLSLDFSSFVS